MAFTFLALVLASPWRSQMIDPIRAVGLEAWGWALAAFLGVYTLLFTTFLTNPDGVRGLYTGLDYWLGQHEVGRGGESWSFYLVVLFGVEWPVLLLGAVGAVVSFRRPTLLRLFLIWGFVLSLVVYSWAGEKFAWLVLHPLLPLLLLAGVGVQAIWETRRRWYGKVGAVAVVLGFAYAGYASYLVNAEHRADPRELLVSTQSSEEAKRVADEVVARAERRPTTITVDSSEGATFPWAWYFRDLPVGYLELGAGSTAPAPDTDVLILTRPRTTASARSSRATTAREFPFRVWWVRDYDAMSPAAWWRWFTEARAVEPDRRHARVALRAALAGAQRDIAPHVMARWRGPAVSHRCSRMKAISVSHCTGRARALTRSRLQSRVSKRIWPSASEGSLSNSDECPASGSE